MTENPDMCMACPWLTLPLQQNIDAKRTEKLTKYRQLAFETRERRLGYDITVQFGAEWKD